MYIRRKVYSYSEPEEQLYSVTMTEEQLSLFSEFLDAYEEALYSDFNDLTDEEKALAAAGAVGATTAAAGAGYLGHRAIKKNGGYKEVAKKAWEGTKDTAKNAVEKAKDAGKNAAEKAKEAGKFVTDKTKEGAKSVKEGAQKAGGGIKGAFKDFMSLGGTKEKRQELKKLAKTHKKGAAAAGRELKALKHARLGRNAVIGGAGTLAAAGAYKAGKSIYDKLNG